MSDFDPDLGRRTATDKRMHFRLTTGFFTGDNKLGDVFDPVERIATLGLLAACIAKSREHGSDGHVVLEEVCAETGLPLEYGKTLIAHAALHQADHGCRRCPQPRVGHVYVHDCLEHNRSAAQERQTLESRRQGGAAAAAKRWEGHQPKIRERRPPGRPRKNPVAPAVPATDLLEPAGGRDTLNAEDLAGTHPAEARARQEVAKKSARLPKPKPEFEAWVVTAANRLADLIAGNDLNGKRPNVTDTWMNTIRLMHERDGREIEKIQNAIEWSQKHHFYSTIILSPANLRKHFNAMHRRAIAEHRQQNAGVRRSAPAAAPARLPQDNSLFDDDYLGGGR